MEQANKNGSPALAPSLALLAKVCAAQHSYAAAEELLQRSLEITRHDFGDRTPYFAVLLSNLATVRQKQKSWAAAESCTGKRWRSRREYTV